MGRQLCSIAIFVIVFGAPGWTAPQSATALEQQLASINLQRESVQKQLVSVRRAPVRPIAVSPLTPIAMPIALSEPILPPSSWPLLDCPPMEGTEANHLIDAAASQQALSPDLLRSVIRHESAFRPCAVSIQGAQGLMQLMPATAEQFGVTDPFDPRQNIGGGAAFLRQLLNRYGGDLKLALGAYNAGVGRVEAAGGVPNLMETQNYVSGILEDLGINEENEVPAAPKSENPHQVTLQLSLDPKQATKSSVQVSVGN